MELQITTLMADGDHRGALKLMAEAYSGAIGRFCAALTGSRADGEDLLQETFIDAFHALPRYRAESNVRAWLFGIARRVCIRHLRKRDRRSNLLKRWFGEKPESQPEPTEDPAERSEQEEMLRASLLELKPQLREAVLMRYQAGMDHAEIALSLEISPAAARKRVSLGVAALRDALRPLLMEPPEGKTGQEGDHEREESMSARPGPRIVRP
jgi:RNA polymerase sigma-70 factor (ECF subfamily)